MKHIIEHTLTKIVLYFAVLENCATSIEDKSETLKNTTSESSTSAVASSSSSSSQPASGSAECSSSKSDTEPLNEADNQNKGKKGKCNLHFILIRHLSFFLDNADQSSEVSESSSKNGTPDSTVNKTESLEEPESHSKSLEDLADSSTCMNGAVSTSDEKKPDSVQENGNLSIKGAWLM